MCICRERRRLCKPRDKDTCTHSRPCRAEAGTLITKNGQALRSRAGRYVKIRICAPFKEAANIPM